MILKNTSAYTHPPPASAESPPDSRPGNYYVSVRDGARTGLLLGPFKTHADALVHVRAAKDLAIAGNAWAAFYSYGTVRMADDFTKAGSLNPRFPDNTIERKAA